MLKLSIPIYNHFRYGDLDYKRAEIKKATLAQDDAALNASLNVRVARRNYLTALASVEIAERQSLMGKEGLQLVEAAYEAGTGSSLEVTDARRTQLSADVNLASKKLEAQVALLKLLAVIGEDMAAIAR
jgi:outer membrane protein TolC